MAKKNVAKKKSAAKATPRKTTPVAIAPEVASPFVRLVHPIVPAFVVFHVLAITLYALPKPSDQVLENKIEPRGSDALLMYNQKVIKDSAPLYGYLFPSGFWQYWDMFAPDPAQTDIWCDAEVTYLQGSKSMFEYPHMKQMSLPEKFIYERHRKFYERVNMRTAGAIFFRAPFAQAIALKAATDPNDPPVKVTVFTHFLPVPRHDKPRKPEPAYQTETLFTYVVDQHKLFEDRGWKLGIH